MLNELYKDYKVVFFTYKNKINYEKKKKNIEFW
jgi:hypothetical protein